MRKLSSAGFIAMLLGTALPVLAQSQSDQPNKQPGTQGNMPETVMSESMTMQGTIEDVSPRRGIVTLKGMDGNTVKMKVNADRATLSKLHKGDEINAKIWKSAAVMLAKPGEEPTGAEPSQYVVAARDGSGPSGMIVNTIKTSATIEKIDADKRTVTLKDPDGKTVNLKVDDRVKDLNRFKQGDKIIVRYTEAAAISVTKPSQGEH
jgi:Cu/Ag efflux protein CusF